MTITKESGRQDAIVGKAEGTYEDVESGVYAAAVDVPCGAIVIGGGLSIPVLFNSGTTDKFSIGTKIGSAGAVANSLAAQSEDVTAAGTWIPIVPNGAEFTSAGSVGIVWTGDGTAPSAGTFKLIVIYIKDGRVAFSQG